MREEIWLNHSKKCGICGRFMRLKDVTIDHIIPKSKGGANHIDNYQPAHKICNGIKGNTMPKDFKGKLSIEMITKKEKIKIFLYRKESINTAWENSQRNMVDMFRRSRESLQSLPI